MNKFGMFKLLINDKSAQLIAKTISNEFEIINEIFSQSHYEIVKAFFPNFDRNMNYENFTVFPCSNTDIKITGIGSAIKLHGNDVLTKNETNFKKIDNQNIYEKKLIYEDFLKLFENKIPYGIFFIYEIDSYLYLITTTYKNNVIILNKAKSLDKLFYKNVIGKNIFNFHPLSEQGIKFIYYNNKITGVVNGIGTL